MKAEEYVGKKAGRAWLLLHAPFSVASSARLALLSRTREDSMKAAGKRIARGSAPLADMRSHGTKSAAGGGGACEQPQSQVASREYFRPCQGAGVARRANNKGVKMMDMSIHDGLVLLGGVWEPIVKWRTQFTIFTPCFTPFFKTGSGLYNPE